MPHHLHGVCIALLSLTFLAKSHASESIGTERIPTFDIEEVPLTEYESSFGGKISLGSLSYSERLDLRFELKNRTTRSLELSKVEPGCACTNVEVPQGKFAVGSTIPVRLVLHPPSHGPDVEYHHSFTLHAGLRRPIRLDLSYRFPGRVQFVRRSSVVQFVDEPDRRTFDVGLAVSDDFDPSALAVASDPPNQVRFKRIHAGQPDERRWRAEFELLVPHHEVDGRTVRLVLRDKKERDIGAMNVVFQVDSRVEIVPAVLDLDRVSEDRWTGNLLIIDRGKSDKLDGSWNAIVDARLAGFEVTATPEAVNARICRLIVSASPIDNGDVVPPTSQPSKEGELKLQVRSVRGEANAIVQCTFQESAPRLNGD